MTNDFGFEKAWTVCTSKLNHYYDLYLTEFKNKEWLEQKLIKSLSSSYISFQSLYENTIWNSEYCTTYLEEYIEKYMMEAENPKCDRAQLVKDFFTKLSIIRKGGTNENMYGCLNMKMLSVSEQLKWIEYKSDLEIQLQKSISSEYDYFCLRNFFAVIDKSFNLSKVDISMQKHKNHSKMSHVLTLAWKDNIQQFISVLPQQFDQKLGETHFVKYKEELYQSLKNVFS